LPERPKLFDHRASGIARCSDYRNRHRRLLSTVGSRVFASQLSATRPNANVPTDHSHGPVPATTARSIALVGDPGLPMTKAPKKSSF
jgi:hypothetical protein